MYAQKEKPNEKESQMRATSMAPIKRNEKQGYGFVDNRPKVGTQRTLQKVANESLKLKKLAQMQMHANKLDKNDHCTAQKINDNAHAIQLATVTVRNNTNNYSSGWVTAETQSTGVNTGPRDEAQRVAAIAGGTWVGGHMVNDRLGGTGGYSNIVPITSSMNSRHHTIENGAQQKVGGGLGPYQVRYNMDILARNDFDFGGGNYINNLPITFQQNYDYQLKTGGAVTNVAGVQLDMFNYGTQTFT